MLMSIRFYFLLPALQEMTHTLASCLYLSGIFCSFSAASFAFILCFYFILCNIYFYSSVYCMWSHLFVLLVISSLSHFISIVSPSHYSPLSFLCSPPPPLSLSLSEARLTHWSLSSYLIAFSLSLSVLPSLHLCPLSLLCPFTLCPSQLIAFSVYPVFSPISLFLPSSHFFSKSFHLLPPVFGWENTSWGFSVPKCQPLIAFCRLGRRTVTERA